MVAVKSLVISLHVFSLFTSHFEDAVTVDYQRKQYPSNSSLCHANYFDFMAGSINLTTEEWAQDAWAESFRNPYRFRR